MTIRSANELYRQYYDEKYQEFILSDAAKFTLRAPASAIAWNAAVSSKRDRFVKETCHPDVTKGKVHFIKKNKIPHAVLWETKAKTLKEGVRWGIVKAESITGQVISTLGQYRIIAHERIVDENNLLVSNTQALKLALLDVYQDRFEALQRLESLVNKHAGKKQYQRAIHKYINKLKDIKKNIVSKFSDLRLEEEGIDSSGLKYKGLGYADLPDKIIKHIEEDIKNARNYRKLLVRQETTKEANRARGNNSVLVFVKRQMHKNLYEFQGFNQNVVFSLGAWSRGELNDYIEDARDLIDKHKPDLRNAVSREHHGLFASENQEVVYDFSLDALSPERERQALKAISFIEGWDKVDYTSNWHNPTVINQSNPQKPKTAELQKISATKWYRHRNFGTSLFYYLVNWFRGILVPTKPWSGEIRNFHLYAATLVEKARPDFPLWMKVWHFLEIFGVGLKDIFKGIRNFGQQFVINLKLDIQDNWAATKALPSLKTTLAEVDRQIKSIKTEEEKRLKSLGRFTREPVKKEGLKILAKARYHLGYGEEHDLLTAMMQGLSAFTGHFTHNLFTKDPVGALIFSTAFVVGGITIFFPVVSKTFFGSGYVKLFTKFAELVGSTTLSKAACGSLIQGQIAHSVWGMADGPGSAPVAVAKAVLEDPVSSMILFGLAYGIGYAMAKVPVIGKLIRAELGSSKLLNYPVIGIKLGAGVILILVSDDKGKRHSVEIPYDLKKLTKITEHLQKDPVIMQNIGLKLQQLELVQTLSGNVEYLNRIEPDTQFELERQIDELFLKEPEKAGSFKKLIHPEEERLIAYQTFAVPLGYLPALANFGFSFIQSAAAWLIDNPHYTAPIKRSTEALFKKIGKDITRIYLVLYYSPIISVAVSPFKALALIFIMLIGRITAFAGVHSGLGLYRGLGSIHDLYINMQELFYPVRAMKSVVYADPVHTATEIVSGLDDLIEESYTKLNNKLPARHIKKPPLSLADEEHGQHKNPLHIDRTKSEINVKTPESSRPAFG